MDWNLVESILIISLELLIVFMLICNNDEHNNIDGKLNMLNQKIEELIEKTDKN